MIGSPFNTNFFRIAGPNVGGAGINTIQTTLFSVQGKIMPQLTKTGVLTASDAGIDTVGVIAAEPM